MMGRMFLRTALATALGIGLHLGTLSPALAQGVPVVDTQNIAQNIQQLRQMIEDEILQNEQLTQLREQLATLTEQLGELQKPMKPSPASPNCRKSSARRWKMN